MVSELVHWAKALATKPDELSLSHGIHMVEEDN